MSVYEDMVARLTEPSNLVFGSFALENLLAVADELERIQLTGIDYMPNRFFPTLATGENLTLAAANFGVERKAALPATATITITGEAGTVIDGTIKVCAGDIIYYCSDATIGSTGGVTVKATCEDGGEIGNVPAEAINEFADTYAGLYEVINATAATGGMDEENDADLLARVKARWAYPSAGGNESDYVRWSLEVENVWRVKVLTPNAGNVAVYVIAKDGNSADILFLAKVRDALNAKRPVGASVTVTPAQEKAINITCSVTLQSGYALGDVKTRIESAVREYLKDISLTLNTVSYYKIADLLFVEGVQDISNYRLNGATASVSLAATEYPVLQEVTVNA